MKKSRKNEERQESRKDGQKEAAVRKMEKGRRET